MLAGWHSLVAGLLWNSTFRAGLLVQESVRAMGESSVMQALSAVILQRKKEAGPEQSYVTSLLSSGVEKIGEKVMEEAMEVVEAAGELEDAGREHLVKEVADLIFHAVVMLRFRDIGWEAVEAELGRRFGISGIDEKASREKPHAS